MGSNDEPSRALPVEDSAQPLASLIARVEAATGPDRDLDRALMSLSYKQEPRHIGTTCWDDAHGTCCPGARHLDLSWCDPTTDRWLTTASNGFEFTASLDRALALAERLLPGNWINLTIADEAAATIGVPGAVSGRMLCRGKTPALAVISALLRALQAQPNRHNARDGATPQSNAPSNAK